MAEREITEDAESSNTGAFCEDGRPTKSAGAGEAERIQKLGKLELSKQML
jgi:hypothetical protein